MLSMLKQSTPPRPAARTARWARSKRSRTSRCQSMPSSQSFAVVPQRAVACGALYFMAVLSGSRGAEAGHRRGHVSRGQEGVYSTATHGTTAALYSETEQG